MRQSDLFIRPTRPWNAGRLIGRSIRSHVWAIRQPLKVARRERDLATFAALWTLSCENGSPVAKINHRS